MISHDMDVPRGPATTVRSLSRLGCVVALAIVAIVGLTSLAPRQPARTYASDSPSIAYTALGDSLTAKTGYVDQYTSYVGTELGAPVTLTNLGLVGYTSGGLAYKLVYDQAFKDSVRDANLITVMIGFNDVGLARGAYDRGTCGGADNQACLRSAENAFRDNFTRILSEIRAINGSRNAVIVAADFYNPAIQQQTENGTLDIFIPFVNQISAYIHSISAAYGVSVAEVYEAFNGPDGTEDANAKGYLMADGTHANELGHQVIAAQFEQAIDMGPDGDADGDSLANGAEKGYSTSPLMSDTDGDTLSDGAEVNAYGTDPHTADTDGDGCADGREVGPDVRAGGQRDPTNPWDYFNPTHDGKNRADDIVLVVRQYFVDDNDENPGPTSSTTGYNDDTDRTLLGPNRWNLGAPNGVQRVDDILNMVHQFLHDCV